MQGRTSHWFALVLSYHKIGMPTFPEKQTSARHEDILLKKGTIV